MGPGLVPIAKAVFDEHRMKTPEPDFAPARRRELHGAKDLLNFLPEAPITEAGLRNNIQVGIQYVGSYGAGNGCVPIFNLMEDAATAEISATKCGNGSRSQGVLDDGRKSWTWSMCSLIADEPGPNAVYRRRKTRATPVNTSKCSRRNS